MHRLGIVVLGGDGYMAPNALGCLPRVKRILAEEDSIDLQLALVADIKYYHPNPEVANGARDRLERHFAAINRCDFVDTADRAISRLTQDNSYREYDTLLIYDGTPTRFHDENLTRSLHSEIPNLYYMGEKPIVTDRASMPLLRRAATRTKFYCDFIEVCDPAVVMMKRFVEQNELRIQSMRFWRAGASGIKHLVGHEQKGVQGGAVLDKAPHDLSIAAMLLGAEQILDVKVHDAKVFYLIPAVGESGDLTFLDGKNDFVNAEDANFDLKSSDRGDRLSIPADGLSQFHVNWSLKSGGEVESTFLVSWIGYTGQFPQAESHESEKAIVGALSDLGISEQFWLLRDTYEGRISSQRRIETQARIAIISAVTAASEPVVLVSNFLLHDVEHSGKLMDRWVQVFWGKERRRLVIPVENADTYRQQKSVDLSNVFLSVIRDCCGRTPTPILGASGVVTVHEALLQAYDQCVEDAASKHANGSFNHNAAVAIISQASASTAP